MGKRNNMPEEETNLLVISGLILLISLIIAVVAYFSFTLGIIPAPGASNAPGRPGASETGSGVASPNGTGGEEATEAETIYFPGFVDFSITNGLDTVYLTNDARNTVNLSFTITDENENTLYNVQDVAPGSEETWQVTQAFEPGTGKHRLTVSIEAASVSDGAEQNGTTTTFVVDMG